MIDTTSNTIFAKLGKFVTVVGAIAALVWVSIQIYGFLFPRASKITASAAFLTIRYPKVVSSPLADLVAGKSVVGWAEWNEFFPKSDDPTRDVEMRQLRDSVKEKLDHQTQNKIESLRILLRVDGLWILTIRNEGNAEAVDVKLELPRGKGFYILNEKFDAEQLSTFEDTISLGNIRPSSEISVKVWTTSGFPIPSTVRITTPEQVVSPQFVDTELNSTKARWDRYVNWAFFIFIFGLGMLASSLLHGWSNRIRTPRAGNTVGESISENVTEQQLISAGMPGKADPDDNVNPS